MKVTKRFLAMEAMIQCVLSASAHNHTWPGYLSEDSLQ